MKKKINIIDFMKFIRFDSTFVSNGMIIWFHLAPFTWQNDISLLVISPGRYVNLVQPIYLIIIYVGWSKKGKKVLLKKPTISKCLEKAM